MCMKQKTPAQQLIAKQAAPAKSAQAELDMDMTDAETDAEVKNKKRRGKKGLTMARTTGTQYKGGGGSGLNIPSKA